VLAVKVGWFVRGVQVCDNVIPDSASRMTAENANVRNSFIMIFPRVVAVFEQGASGESDVHRHKMQQDPIDPEQADELYPEFFNPSALLVAQTTLRV
jgi:hypothetical protein